MHFYSSENNTFVISTLKEMHEFVIYFVKKILKFPSVITLSGDLGSGKTTFAKFLINILNPEISLEQITSPTFTLCNRYYSPLGEIHHYDLYRLKSIEEVIGINLEDSLHNTICLIEWADIAMPIILNNKVHISIDTHNTRRYIRISGA